MNTFQFGEHQQLDTVPLYPLLFTLYYLLPLNHADQYP